jgi:pyruvate dehydrogenase E2 component (dihydrolipoamide acetyltransferase)
MIHRSEKLPPAEQWMQDGQDTLELASVIAFEDVDMTATQEIIAQARQQGIKCTITHVVVRAVALILTRHPDFNRLFLKKKIVYPSHVDIGVAVHTEQTFSTPFEIIVNDAEQKDLVQIGEEIVKQAAQARSQGALERQKQLSKLSRVFFASWMRRALYRRIRSNMTTIRKMVGTFHVSSVPLLQQGASLRFPTSINLIIPRVEERPVVRDGQIVIRPICTMSFMADRHLWDGLRLTSFFSEFKTILESGELAQELPGAKEKLLVDQLPTL